MRYYFIYFKYFNLPVVVAVGATVVVVGVVVVVVGVVMAVPILLRK